MGLASRLAGQLARPRGLAGRLIGNAMDVANRRPTRIALDLLDAQPGERVLDVGCGTGATLSMLLGRTAVEAWGLDPSHTMIAAARKRLRGRARLLEASIESLDLAGGMFDAALALNVLYFEDWDAAMVRRMHRLLRPGGRLVAYVTSRATMENWAFARAGTHRLFDAGELAQALAAGGFAPGQIQVHQQPITSSVQGLVALAVKQG